MRIDDACGGCKQGAHARECRPQRKNFAPTETAQVIDDDAPDRGIDVIELREQRLACRDDQFAATTMIDRASCTVVVQQLLATHAEPGFHRVLRIADAGVDHLGIAGACFGPDRVVLLNDNHFATGHRKPACDRKTDDLGTNHSDLDGVHLTPAIMSNILTPE